MSESRLGPALARQDGTRRFANLWDHLEAELAGLDRLLDKMIARARASHLSGDGSVTGWGHGLFIGDHEVDEILVRRQRHAIDDMDRVVESTLAAGIDLPLVRVAGLFSLSRWERDVLLLCLAPELDRGYERVYAYLHDDATRRLPTVGLAAELVGDTQEQQGLAYARLEAEAPLVRFALVRLMSADGDAHRRTHAIQLDDRIRRLLLGDESWSPHPWLRLTTDELEADDPIARILVRDLRRPSTSSRMVVSLHGPDRGRAVLVARQIAGELRVPVVTVDVPVLLASGGAFEQSLREAARESLLRGAALVLTCPDRLSDVVAESELRLRQLVKAVDDFAWLTFVVASSPRTTTGRPWLTVEVPATPLPDAFRNWQLQLSAQGIDLDVAAVESLAARYTVNHDEIGHVVADAVLRAEVAGEQIQIEHIEAACRDAAGELMAGLARRISPRYGWPDLVLPPDHVNHLQELAAAVRSRHRVMAEWGFGEKASRNTGISALFSGAPGTGKTLAAEIVAGELGLDLYVIDIASVVSKYIGETEKNLSRIFEAAEATSAVLLFDEADALFGKRSEVKDAHDRYANIEISYLLQRIESYRGLVILATNFRRNLDEAFLRRIDFLIEFPFPQPGERLRILRAIIPPEARVDADVDWEFLAGQFQLAGGNLKGAVLHAAYLAADRNVPIGMRQLVRGVRRELDKMGKLSGASDFGPYWHLVGGTDGRP